MSNEITLAKPSAPADARRGDDAADRARFHHRHRPFGGDFRRHHAAVRTHDREIAAKADAAEVLAQALYIAADFRPDVGVDHRRRHALELAIFAHDVVRQRQIRAGQRFAHHCADDALMVGIGVSVQQAHRDRFDAFGGERAAGFGDAGFVERMVHVARAHDALVDFAGQVPRHQRPVAMKEQIIGFRAVAAADDVDVAGAAGDDQSGLGALALDQRVDGDGRAVDQLVDRGSRQAALADAVENALRELMRRRQAFGLDEFLRLVVEADEVGKGAADVDGNSDHRRVPRWCGLNTPAQVERSPVTARQTIHFTKEHNSCFLLMFLAHLVR